MIANHVVLTLSVDLTLANHYSFNDETKLH